MNFISALYSHRLHLVGEGNGHAYGSKVHAAFTKQVQALGRSDLIPEVSYQNGQPQVYGSIGSVRVDVIYGSKENPIYDAIIRRGQEILQITSKTGR